MSKTLQLYSQQPNGVTYANPEDPNFQVRFKFSSQPKLLDGMRTTNHIAEIIVTDDVDVPLGTKTVQDAVSVRIRISGSFESQERVRDIVNSLADQLPSWAQENVFTGFTPTTTPVDPVE